MDPEIVDNFFVTLPSNSSIQYFPSNTQSSFRTKLSSPLVLNGEWEVALTELCMPRNWYNINLENSNYSVSFEEEKLITMKEQEYRIQFEYEQEMDVKTFCDKVNESIGKEMGDESDAVLFGVHENESSVIITVKEGFELHLKPKGARKFLYMLRLPIEDFVITGINTYRYRVSTTVPLTLTFTILKKNLKDVIEHIIPTSSIKDDLPMETTSDLINIFNYNIKLLELESVVSFYYIPSKHQLTITVADNAEIILSEHACPTLLQKLNLKTTTIIKNSQTFLVDPLKKPTVGEVMQLRLFEYQEKTVHESRIENLSLSIGMYKTPHELFKSFQYINLMQLPDMRVKMMVPVAHEITFSKGLADMLGFKNTVFKSGVHVSEYALELHGGITEIFVYCDLVSSHHCGDAFLPLLRIVPCMGETGEQIVRNYQRPLYFPLRKHFIETIQIELKSSTGNDIIFSGGKSYVVLSFRRRKV